MLFWKRKKNDCEEKRIMNYVLQCQCLFIMKWNTTNWYWHIIWKGIMVTSKIKDDIIQFWSINFFDSIVEKESQLK